MKNNTLISMAIALVAFGAGLLPGCGKPIEEKPSSEVASTATSCPEHSIKNCPFCSPAVIEELGFCVEHGVPEAICTQCRNDLEATYRANNDWCGGHGLPESQCEACNPGVLDKWSSMANPAAPTQLPVVPCGEHDIENCPFCTPSVIEVMGFCNGHGVPEAVCTKCRDDLEAAFRSEEPWCEGHGLPESHCEACNPGVLDKYRSPIDVPAVNSAQPDLAVLADTTPRVHMLPSLECSTSSSVVKLTSVDVANRMGIQLESVQRGKLRKTLEAPATIAYDSRSHANLAPRAAGTVVKVHRGLGDLVEAGDVLIVIDSAVLGTAKSKLLQAAAHVGLWQKNSQREEALLKKGLSTQKDALEAETRLVESQIAMATAEQHLANLGLTEEQVFAVKEEGEASSLLNISAPFSGQVIEFNAVVGEFASPEKTVIGIADTSSMWALVDINQSDIRHIQRDQPVLITVDGWPGETFGGRITWLSSEVNLRTRTVKVRAEFDNPEGILRAQSFVTAQIVTKDHDNAVLVPKDAVQWEGCCNVVFERISPTEFVPRKLRLGYDTGDHYEVISGLSGGESVVTQGSFILKTELRKGSIGAGCCEVDHLSK